ncbi:hypothetical protein [Tropicimonas sediminicola]|uniref:hypothetical protein n=1 Tax=Tropicimonas sediminicola TaxID=1031541 RepID=UPI0011322CA5|nr:hypothetical protein [Tropicimonas sediminicola]
MAAGNQGIDSISLKDLKSKAMALRKYRPPEGLTEPRELKGRPKGFHEPKAKVNTKDAETSFISNRPDLGIVQEQETLALEKK